MIATCSSCVWEVDRFTAAEADRALTAHRIRHHGDPTPITQLSNVVGWAEAIEAARTLAATGQEFTLSQLPDVEHHRTSKGKLAAELHRLGICHPVRYERSRRGSTKSSAVAVWHEDRGRCISCPREVVPA